MVNKHDANRFEVYGLVSQSENKDKLKEYLKSVGSDSMRLALASPKDISSYKLSKTPLTLLVSNDGTIEKAWVGLWDDESLAEASSAFGIEFNTQPQAPETASAKTQP
ncbi:MAG TPA: hypothetical protein VGV59_16685 [Pyrinomonadaceae bacterium]|nr:hypothetical protein [Pyrinomonadaceae bacterium]